MKEKKEEYYRYKQRPGGSIATRSIQLDQIKKKFNGKSCMNNQKVKSHLEDGC